MADKKPSNSHPSTKARNAKQKLKRRYAKVREDAQLAGVIPTEPAGAVRDERVDPKTQEAQRTDSIDRAAIKRGWAVPEEKKAKVVDRLLEVFEQVAKDEEGNEIFSPGLAVLQAKNAAVLLKADQMQYERDNPVEAGKAKGGVNINNENNQTLEWEGVLKDATRNTLAEIKDKIDAPLIAPTVPTATPTTTEQDAVPEGDTQAP